MGTEIQSTINPMRSRFTTQAFAAGMLSSFGHNPRFAIRDFSGELQFAPEDPGSARLQIKIKSDSIQLTDDVSDKDRKEIENTMRQDVLEIGRYPEILFESTSVSGERIFEGQYRVKISGNLSLHGVTAPHTLDAHVVINGNQVRAYGDFTLKQTDYRIRLVSVAGGTLKLKDELKFTFDIVAQS